MKDFRPLFFTLFLASFLTIFSSPGFSLDLIVPDTGQVICYDWTDSMECCPGEGEDFYGQDGSFIINPPDLTDNGDGTVIDNLTGLTWEQKTEANETYHYTHSYALNYCDDLTLGSHSDWRVPTRKEYVTILYQKRVSPSLDTDYFPYYTTGTIEGDMHYWTTSEYHDDSSQAWYMFISFGLIDKGPKKDGKKIRCVRGDTLPASNYTTNGDGTVTDNVTGLMWEQKTDDGGSRDKDNVYTWGNALSYCADLLLGTHDDWRLPNTKELDRVVDLGSSSPAIDTTYFPNTSYTPYIPEQKNDGLYWTSTSCSKCHTRKAFAIDFEDGELYYGNKLKNTVYDENFVRCVRNAGPDYDGDGIYPNDNCPYIYNSGQENNDADELGNVCDNCPDVTNADQADADCDRVGDVCDNCPDDSNPNQEDNDQDGTGDLCDPDDDNDGISDDDDNCPYKSNPGQGNNDTDELGNLCDNCPDDSNPNQEDNDQDGTGDLCDPDDDNDGISDDDDNCPYISNPGQENNDTDELGNVCDNCPDVTNADQADADGDRMGDVCDPDDDNDAICNPGESDPICTGTDNCPLDYNPGQGDAYPPDGNDIGDACDCEGDFDCDGDVDGTDASAFKEDFGRSSIVNPCTNEDPCNGDFSCDADVDGTDASKFKEDFGRSSFINPCPACIAGAWCAY